MVSTLCKPCTNDALSSVSEDRNKMTAHLQAEIFKQSSGEDTIMRYSLDLDVDYITERLIAVSFPAGGLEAQYRSNLHDVVQMLKSKHQEKFVIFNLSKRRHDIHQLSPQVYDLGWPDHLAPSLEKLCSICKHIETWLKQDPHHVAVLHCKGGRGPIGVVVLAYMNYVMITSNSETAVDRYAMKRFLEAKTESAMQPSQYRYVNYFTGLLTKSIQVNSEPLFLHHVIIHGVPNYDINGGCRPFLRVYQGMQPIFTSSVYSVPEGTSRFVITLDQALPIRGDILVKCYHKKLRTTTCDVIFRCQFHTTAIMESHLIFKKADLDDASTDARFPAFTKVEFVFSHTPDQLHGSDYVAGSNFPVDDTDESLIHWDSYESFDKIIEGGDYPPEMINLSASINNNIPHTSAPDGSLYAEVQKTPSPVQHDKAFFHSLNQVAPVSPTSNKLTPQMPGAVDYDMGPRSPMQTTQMAVLRAKMNAQIDPACQTIKQRTPSPLTPTSDPPSPMQPYSESVQLGTELKRPTELLNGPKSSKMSSDKKRAMNYKEKRDLDDLLRGIGEDMTVLSGPDSERSRQEVLEKRKIVNIPAQMSHMSSQEHGHPSTHRSFASKENPYAEILDAASKRDQSPHDHGSHHISPPVDENISFTQVEKLETSRIPDLEKHRILQLHDNPTYAVTRESDPNITSDTSLRTQQATDMGNSRMSDQHMNATNHESSEQTGVWKPQPLRAKKEQLVFIYKEDPTCPQGIDTMKQGDQVEPTTIPAPIRTSEEIGDDSMTWLQRQQQKLKEKRDREGVQPNFHAPNMDFPKDLQYRHDLSTSYNNKNQGALLQHQVQVFREEIPTDNLSWLEKKQKRLRMKREQPDQSTNPLIIDTSNQGPYSGASVSPAANDFAGLSANGAVSAPSAQLNKSDLESSPNQLSNITTASCSVDPGPLTPPHTYEHESISAKSEMWQSNQRRLNRQTSDITYDREKPIITRRQQDTAQAQKLPYGMGDGITSLPPAGPHLMNTHKEITGYQESAPNLCEPVKDKMNTYHQLDLHIDESNSEEPFSLEGKVADRIADITFKMSSRDQQKSHSPTGPYARPSKAKRIPRYTPQQSGYDSDTAIQECYDSSHHRNKEASPEKWLHNPGGLPIQESEYWNRMEGLTSPNIKEQWARKPEYDVASSSESLHNDTITPRFPVGPKAYKNMVWTPIAAVGRPPHGPDAPYPLSSIKPNERDIFDTTRFNPRPHPVDFDAPDRALAHPGSLTTPEAITVTHKRMEIFPDQNGSEEIQAGSSFCEAISQQPIMAKVERVPTHMGQVEIKVEKKVVQNGQYYPVQAKAERVPVTNYSKQESDDQGKTVSPQYIVTTPPPPKKEVTFQDARGGVPEWPTGPQALAGTSSQQSHGLVEEDKIFPTFKKPVEIAPTWPIELEVHIKNEGMGPAVGDVQVKAKNTPPSSPQQHSPSIQSMVPHIQEPTVLVDTIKKEKAEPVMSNQMMDLSIQPPPPMYPTYSDRIKNRPPEPLYPTFSDRHRKAATGRMEEVPPEVANGYHTMYDNRGASKAKRASTGSDMMWPVRSTHLRKASDGNAGPTRNGRTTPSNFYLMQQPSPYSSSLSLAETSVDKVRFVKDLSAWWYKPHISRDEAISMLKDKCPGQFVVRDSNSFPGAFGLAVKVAQLPPNAPPSKKVTDPASELVRHFLIEPNPRGVRLKGCANEPIFGSLSALIYQHTLTQLALPCKLQLPDSDPSGLDAADTAIDLKSAHALLSQGAACNVLYLTTMEMESLTGPSAVREATSRLSKMKDKLESKRVVVHFKVSLKGITLTDNHRKLFFRRHYPVQSVLYCGMDSGSRKWKRKDGSDEAQAKIFGFVSRKPGSKTDNQCHLFAEYEIEQPASAIVSFVTKVLLGSTVHN